MGYDTASKISLRKAKQLTDDLREVYVENHTVFHPYTLSCRIETFLNKNELSASIVFTNKPHEVKVRLTFSDAELLFIFKINESLVSSISSTVTKKIIY